MRAVGAGGDRPATTLLPVTDSEDGPRGDELDERLRLFAFATAEKRADYLRVLRAFDSARAAYVVLLHADDVAEWIRRAGGAELPAAEIGPLLDQLHRWGVLERSYDGTRAATLAEYRNRHYVYQFTQPGFQAFRAVAGVLDARGEEASLSRLVLPELLADLGALAEANRRGDAEGRALLSLAGRPGAHHRGHPGGVPGAQGHAADAHARVQHGSGAVRAAAGGGHRGDRTDRRRGDARAGGAVRRTGAAEPGRPGSRLAGALAGLARLVRRR